MKFEVGERVQVIYENELKTGAITNLYIVDALVNFESGGQKEACIPFAYMMKLDQPEPVIVRKFVAEWYEDRKHRLDAALWDVVGDLYIGEITDIQNFIFTSGEKIETLSAMKNGYVVDDTKYIVRVGESLLFQRFDDNEAVFIVDDKPGAEEQSKVFDIKKEAESVAEPIGGTVEEVEAE